MPTTKSVRAEATRTLAVRLPSIVMRTAARREQHRGRMESLGSEPRAAVRVQRVGLILTARVSTARPDVFRLTSNQMHGVLSKLCQRASIDQHLDWSRVAGGSCWTGR